ncbi:hypothetical protein KC909_03865 [Candidatus Dojkabacteria bacterium]|uniref:Uncharacterized protein n=1 Tax=Candidatus Dojkabacteria bacterium TaxID=2099670 RepID=A0A955L5Z2_9BACT|nr:hypothetical protein [Candidatus Dojkabacteria bacterium]
MKKLNLSKEKKFRFFSLTIYIINKIAFASLYIYTMFLSFWVYIFSYSQLTFMRAQMLVEGNGDIDYTILFDHLRPDWEIYRNAGLMIFVTLFLLVGIPTYFVKVKDKRPMWGIGSNFVWIVGLGILFFSNQIGLFFVRILEWFG